MQPQIKSMQPEHVTQVAAIAAEVFSQPWSKESFLQALQQENACFLVACDKERVLGYCCMYMAADEGEIDNVAVIPQARRLGIRVKGSDGEKYFAHTLNNTVVAPPRMLIAFLENNINEDGSIRIPEALRYYMRKDKIEVPKK